MTEKRRKRSKPPGGFYAQYFRSLELADLESALQPGIADEIAVLRVAMRRFFEMFEDVCLQNDVREARSALAVLGQSATRIADLLKMQKELGGGDETLAIISRAINGVLEEFGRGQRKS